nr:hypothetical protein [Mycoplasmopsis bovis]
MDLDGLKKFNNFVNDILEKKDDNISSRKNIYEKRFKPLVKSTLKSKIWTLEKFT